MHYIILDLEWNQPMSYQSATYRKYGDRLIFEMIQIGAVRLNEGLEVEESLSLPIAPTHYIRIHPRIRRMTGLGPEELAGAPAFREALEKFSAWCGEDYTLLTWGCDDVSVLQQNIDFFECGDIPLAPLCDIQKLFSDVHQLKDRSSLRSAMEMAGVDPREDKPFHNALNDAYYTALVFRTLPDPSAVLKYVQTPKKLIHTHRSPTEKTAGESFPNVEAALASESVSHPVCPRCGRTLTMDGEYVQQSPDKYIAIAKCRNHGRMLLRLRLIPDDDGTLILRRSTAPANANTAAYVHTKQLQMDERKARLLAESGSLPDPNEELLRVRSSDMPFQLYK